MERVERTEAERLVTLRRWTTNGKARELRLAAKLSQADIARTVETDQTAVGRWERGERLPRGAAAMRYLNLLESVAAAMSPEHVA